jgi:hypothetical protein
MTVTLHAYQQAERAIAHDEGRIGVMIHATVTVLVSVLLIVLNLTVASGFPWSPFPIVGMGAGLFAHWWFGYHKLDEQLDKQQSDVEARAVGTP